MTITAQNPSFSANYRFSCQNQTQAKKLKNVFLDMINHGNEHDAKVIVLDDSKRDVEITTPYSKFSTKDWLCLDTGFTEAKAQGVISKPQYESITNRLADKVEEHTLKFEI